MGDYSRREEGSPPQLLNLIPRDCKWEEKRVTGEGFSEEEEKLELSLGPPGGGQCQKRAVGWPPICSFRKSVSKGSCLFVKVNMDGIPIGRKLDLRAYHSYDKLCCAVDDLFKHLLAAQADSEQGLLNGKGEYTLVYEDNEGDIVLVGDVPWHMFISTAKRLRVLKTTDLPKTSRPESVAD